MQGYSSSSHLSQCTTYNIQYKGNLSKFSLTEMEHLVEEGFLQYGIENMKGTNLRVSLVQSLYWNEYAILMEHISKCKPLIQIEDKEYYI